MDASKSTIRKKVRGNVFVFMVLSFASKFIKRSNYSMSDSQTTSTAVAVTELSLAAKIEAMLFVSAEPVPVAQLSQALDVTASVVERGLKELDEILSTRGLRLQRNAGRVQLTTAPELAPLVELFLGLEATTHLSRAALETLAIIAYQQPCTRPQVDSIRGVNSDGMMKSLLSKGLVQESGRTDGPGRPILYSTTPEFLQHFGLGSIIELPPLAMSAEPDNEHSVLLKG
jgi:segregation and condensation protein B